MREGSHDASGRHESRHCGGDNDMVQVYMHTHNTQGHIMTRHTTHTHKVSLWSLHYIIIKLELHNYNDY